MIAFPIMAFITLKYDIIILTCAPIVLVLCSILHSLAKIQALIEEWKKLSKCTKKLVYIYTNFLMNILTTIKATFSHTTIHIRKP